MLNFMCRAFDALRNSTLPAVTRLRAEAIDLRDSDDMIELWHTIVKEEKLYVREDLHPGMAVLADKTGVHASCAEIPTPGTSGSSKPASQ